MVAALWYLVPLSDDGLVRMDTVVCHGAVCCHHPCRCSDVVIVDFHNGCLLSAVWLVVVRE